MTWEISKLSSSVSKERLIICLFAYCISKFSVLNKEATAVLFYILSLESFIEHMDTPAKVSQS